MLDIDGYTPLHKCVLTENSDLMRLLIDNGADLDICDNIGNSPLHSAIKQGSSGI